jgi:hypothetical protein
MSLYSTTTNPSEIAARLIIKIVQLLKDPESSNYFRDLKLELESLQRTLALAGLAIRAYEYTPLGRSLANIMNRESEQRRVALQDLLNTIDGYRGGLNSTRIRYHW